MSLALTLSAVPHIKYVEQTNWKQLGKCNGEKNQLKKRQSKNKGFTATAKARFKFKTRWNLFLIVPALGLSEEACFPTFAALLQCQARSLGVSWQIGETRHMILGLLCSG